MQDTVSCRGRELDDFLLSSLLSCHSLVSGTAFARVSGHVVVCAVVAPFPIARETDLSRPLSRGHTTVDSPGQRSHTARDPFSTHSAPAKRYPLLSGPDTAHSDYPLTPIGRGLSGAGAKEAGSRRKA
jgi:hypothetical protein